MTLLESGFFTPLDLDVVGASIFASSWWSGLDAEVTAKLPT